MTSIYHREKEHPIAYHFTQGREDKPAVVFLSGFRSDMEGTKAVFLEEFCGKHDISYLRFDYSGHGQSGGAFEDVSVRDWLNDTIAIIAHILPDADILPVGSSMGGWLAFLYARQFPDRIKGLIGLAAAPDFPQWMEKGMDSAQREMLMQKGFFTLPNDYDDPYVITKALLEDGGLYGFLSGPPVEFPFPVRLIQGKKDEAVPWQTAGRIKTHLGQTDCDITYLPDADHRLSDPESLQTLQNTLEKLI